MRAAAQSIETDAAADYVVVPSFTKYKTDSNENAPYKVLIGAELSVDVDGIEAPKTVTCKPYKGTPVVFEHVSPRSILGPPYRVAVACTCYDWRLRNGMPSVPADDVGPGPLTSREQFFDAGAGCKHMMLCNATVLNRPFVTLGPSIRAEQTLKTFLASSHKPPESGAYSTLPVTFDDDDQLMPESMP